jgi:hypothetical protein
MFGLSFAKLLLLAVVFAVAWYGIKHLQARERQAAVRRAAGNASAEGAGRIGATEDLVKCPVCTTYVARAAAGCGRADCPRAHG